MHRLVLVAALLLLVVAPVAAQPNLLLGPTLMTPTPTSVRVWWHLDAPAATHAVEYGPTAALGQTARRDTLTAYPFLDLAGLTPGQTVHYRVRSGSTTSPVYTFTLPDPDGPLTLGIWADNQSGYRVFTDHTVPALTAAQPDLLLAVGDLVDRGATYDHWPQQLYGPARDLLARVPWIPARGNHDHESESRLDDDMLPLPQTGHWYALSYGPVRFVVLDTNEEDPAQLTWLTAEVTSDAWANARFRIVFFHHPPFTSLWDSPDYDGEALLRAVVVPLLEQHGADLVMSGHAHDYERLLRHHLDGSSTTYLVVGGGGGGLDTVPTFTWPFSVVRHSRHHIVVAEVLEDRMELRVTDTQDGTLLDLFMIPLRQATEATPTQSSYKVVCLNGNAATVTCRPGFRATGSCSAETPETMCERVTN